MIRARRLFLVPALCSLLLLIPFVGIVIYMLVIAGWYSHNNEEIHLYFRGINFRKNEYSNEDQLK